MMEPGTLADARKAQEQREPRPLVQRITLDTSGLLAKLEEAKAAQDALVVENPATCDHRADVLWLAHRLRISEHRVADLTRQKKHLERRLRKALRGRRKH